MKYTGLTLGTIEAVVNKLGGMEGVEKFLRGELAVTNPASTIRVENALHYFSVTTDGTSGTEWLRRLKDRGIEVGGLARSLLLSTDFKPTHGQRVEVCLFPTSKLSGGSLVAGDIRKAAEQRLLMTPSAEIACHISEMFDSNALKKTGFRYIVVMHEPIACGPDGHQSLLCINCHNHPTIDINNGYLPAKLDSQDGVAYVVSRMPILP